MTFIALDDKQECVGIYTKGELKLHGDIPDNLDRTWRYMPFLHDSSIEYAHLYCGGKTFDEVCPEEMKPEWQRLTKKLRAFITSFFEAKINLNEVCFYDLVPVQFLKEYFDAKCRIIDSVFLHYKKPVDYEHRLNLEILLSDIRSRGVGVDTQVLKDRLSEVRVRNFIKKLKATRHTVDFDQFGSKTGRLTSLKGTFPILSMDKSFRSVIKPKNGWFVELDYNAADLRTLLALSGIPQPDEDIHAWNAEKLGITREKAKADIFAWLYGSTQVDGTSFAKLYDADAVKEKYWNGFDVKNHFGRMIPSNEYHSLNYIIQSTTSDLVLRQAVKVHALLQDLTSHIAFIIHDSIIVDLDILEKDKIMEMARVFSKTDLGVFRTSLKVGKDLNKMIEVN